MRLLFALFCLTSLPAPAATLAELEALGNDGSLCHGFRQKSLQKREREEALFLQRNQVLHKSYSTTRPLVPRQNEHLERAVRARRETCSIVKKAEKAAIIREKKFNPSGASCQSFRELMDFLSVSYRELDSARREIQEKWDDLTLKDSELYVDNKNAVLATQKEAGKEFRPLFSEMAQIYIHSTGTLLRPIQQGMSWELTQMNLRLDKIDSQYMALAEKAAKCPSPPSLARPPAPAPRSLRAR